MSAPTDSKIRSRGRWLLPALLLLVSPLVAGEKPLKTETAADLRAHEWGTFTTLHWPNGRQVPWYQPNAGGVSELPSFVHPRLVVLRKGMMRTTARMETPVIYFYTDRKQAVDVSVAYPGGAITEYFPGTPGPVFDNWKQLELIPPSEAGDLAKQLPIDPKVPDNHYFEARAVPEAALVRRVLPQKDDGGESADEVEKFVFYRGAGNFDSGLRVSMDSATGSVSVENYNPDSGIGHGWVVQSSAEAVRWKKLPDLPAYLPAEAGVSPFPEPTRLPFAALEAGDSREASIAALRTSMVAALTDSGLTEAEAAAMVATWDEQWIEEPGQRVFSIVPAGVIDELLPLEISPKPAEIVRVFVHRAELVSPETLQTLEMSMAPDTAPETARAQIAEAKLGRFIHGAIEAVAEDVGRRIAWEYQLRGLEALRPVQPAPEVTQVGSE